MSKPIGTLLVEAGVITEEQLGTALGRQRSYGGRLATYCWQLGFADERTLSVVLSRQLGVPFVVFSRSAVPTGLAKELPQAAANKLSAMPVRREGRSLVTALANPLDIATLDELRFGTGCRVIEHGALLGVLQSASREIYELHAAGQAKFYTGPDLEASKVKDDNGYLEIVRGDEILRPTEAAGQRAGAPSSPAQARVQETFADFDLGAGWTETEAQQQPIPAPASTPALSLLVVDDEPDIRQILVEFFRKAGYSVREAPGGLEALQMLQMELPDAIVLDAMLPGVHGFDICQRVKKSAATEHVKVVMISAIYRGWRYSDDIQRMYGADAFLEKPFRLEELKRVLDQVMAGRQGAASIDELSARANAMLHKSAAAYRQGHKSQAVEFLEQAIAAAPFSVDLHRRLGLLFQQMAQPYRAISSFERVAELETTYANLLTLARLYEQAGFTHKAFEAWERCMWLCQDGDEVERIRAHMNQLMSR